ncbi:MetQ/NlpA family ABC transporter substrate-binding protein [Saccharothrix algeriensis]|uniref:Lipoprotein n=1 Tax=Saccharothrix algeriensis TaxID=173560 RepID=A0A8T8I3J6_9PSEU|nr:MetQ/NlpA family ABC transporter substrate-binding protein [Saccharothrix algeriensis]MBM7811548.1 D-methionine transport system substrate-binding protein [Saccharothrix algeriensis]QTR05362.1 MetQ/NlpA family ABC transporter substrate-binding protein [Saccharothrix algeriensis]
MRIRAALVAVLLIAVGCGSGQTGGAASDPDAPLKVGVSPVPHAQVLKYVADNLAAEKGLKVEVVEFTDYVQPNTALVDGSLDANYFQTVPYLETFKADSGATLEWIGPVHVEPLGVYSKKHKKLADLPDGAKVAVANDATNEARGLRLLQDNGLIKLKSGAGETATVRDIAENPKNLEFIELEAAQLPRSLDDTDASVVNGNYAIDAQLKPAEDALALEKAEGNPNANGLVTRAELKDDKRIKDLLALLQSQQVKDYIKETFAGSVLAV